MKAIMKDIARMAGVSPGTVSNALNNRKGVSEEKKQKILQVAEELGYNKASDKEDIKVIRFIIYKKHGYVVSDTPFFSVLIEGIERECRMLGYELLVSHIIHDEHNNKDVYDIIKEEQVSGVLLLATEMDDEDLKPFIKLDIPIVLLDSYFRNHSFDYVLMNNSNGAYKAVKHLIENGHTKIGCLGSSININNFYYRYEGFVNAVTEAGLTVSKEFQLFLEPTFEGAYRDMKVILENRDIKLPTAYFAFNDIIAIGAIRAMKESNIKIPEQISVIGFDDMPFCDISSPRLTTLRVHKQYIGKTAVRRLMQKISDGDDIKVKIEIDTELIERESLIMLK